LACACIAHLETRSHGGSIAGASLFNARNKVLAIGLQNQITSGFSMRENNALVISPQITFGLSPANGLQDHLPGWHGFIPGAKISPGETHEPSYCRSRGIVIIVSIVARATMQVAGKRPIKP
jgi:hypothetical protein